MRLIATIKDNKISPDQHEYLAGMDGIYVIEIQPLMTFTRKQQNTIFGIARKICGETGISMDSLLHELEQDTGIDNLRVSDLTKREADLAIKCLLDKSEFREIDCSEFR